MVQHVNHVRRAINVRVAHGPITVVFKGVHNVVPVHILHLAHPVVQMYPRVAMAVPVQHHHAQTAVPRGHTQPVAHQHVRHVRQEHTVPQRG